MIIGKDDGHFSQWPNLRVRNTFVEIKVEDADSPVVRRRACSCTPCPSTFSTSEGSSDGDGDTRFDSMESLSKVNVDERSPQASPIPASVAPVYASSAPVAREVAIAREYRTPVTTMMIRNIPCRCSKEEIMTDIDAMGFAGTYDFFYIPRDRRDKSNLGYAFINFLEEAVAADFKARFNGHRIATKGKNNTSQKICVVVPASIQGLENNLVHFRHTAVIRSGRRPCFFPKSQWEAGKQQPRANIVYC